MGQAQRTGIFLDKDGALLDDVPCSVDPRAMRFAPGVPKALGRLARLDLPLIVVSNQTDVAMGKTSETTMLDVERGLQRMFADCGAVLSGFHYCPHHPDAAVDAYRRACTYRKPMPGLLLKAAANHGIDTTGSWMIGDMLDDVEAGLCCGCRTVLINDGNETRWEISARRLPNFVVEHIEEAADIIVLAHEGGLPALREAATSVAGHQPDQPFHLPRSRQPNLRYRRN
ncbi:MAG: HAD-IIIA family hydrolase [Betaproteobacteria bacterium]